jgi:hypothetical protein
MTKLEWDLWLAQFGSDQKMSEKKVPLFFNLEHTSLYYIFSYNVKRASFSHSPNSKQQDMSKMLQFQLYRCTVNYPLYILDQWETRHVQGKVQKGNKNTLIFIEPQNAWTTLWNFSFCLTRISGRYATLILALAESFSLEPCTFI